MITKSRLLLIDLKFIFQNLKLKMFYLPLNCCFLMITRCHTLTERNGTGPPCGVGRPTAHASGGRPLARRQRYRRQTLTDDSDRRRRRRHQRPLLVWPLYILCMRASNRSITKRQVLSACSNIQGCTYQDNCCRR